jgi:hypothetical protein
MRKILLSLLVVPAVAAAHHGWSEYDSTKTLKLTGKVVESGYEHPHGFVRLETAGSDGKAGKTWHVVLAPPSRMEARGLPRERIAKGVTATVEGYANRSKPEELRAERISVNGKTVELR